MTIVQVFYLKMSELGIEKVSERIHIIHERLRNVKSLMTEIMRDITWVELTLDRRVAKKNADDESQSQQTKQPTGLAVPVHISETMCRFLNVPIGNKVSRVEATRAVHEYIKTHNLQDANNKKIIKPDKVLGELFQTHEPVNYLGMQKYFKHHFVKNAADNDDVEYDDDNMPISELTENSE